MKEYQPIDCELYNFYESVVIHRQRLRVAWYDSYGQAHLQVLSPFDLKTFQQAEYLLARTGNGRLMELRLDCIIRATPLSGHEALDG